MSEIMDALQQRNLSEIGGLNQRGGRTLSFVDLIRAGTMSAEMVAYCWTAIAQGASFLAAARPGGAGKSTVLANLLALLPPEEEIVTFTESLPPGPLLPRRRGLQGGGEGPETRRPCSLAHEIGSGHWYGYIWGAQVREFLSLKSRGHRLAACLHADTLDEVTEALCTPPLSCSPAQMRGFDLILFIHVLPQGRKVVAVYGATGDGYHEAMRWDPGAGRWSLDLGGADAEEYARRLADVREMVGEGEGRFEAVREKVLAKYLKP